MVLSIKYYLVIDYNRIFYIIWYAFYLYCIKKSHAVKDNMGLGSKYLLLQIITIEDLLIFFTFMSLSATYSYT